MKEHQNIVGKEDFSLRQVIPTPPSPALSGMKSFNYEFSVFVILIFNLSSHPRCLMLWMFFHQIMFIPDRRIGWRCVRNFLVVFKRQRWSFESGGEVWIEKSCKIHSALFVVLRRRIWALLNYFWVQLWDFKGFLRALSTGPMILRGLVRSVLLLRVRDYMFVQLWDRLVDIWHSWTFLLENGNLRIAKVDVVHSYLQQ